MRDGGVWEVNWGRWVREEGWVSGGAGQRGGLGCVFTSGRRGAMVAAEERERESIPKGARPHHSLLLRLSHTQNPAPAPPLLSPPPPFHPSTPTPKNAKNSFPHQQSSVCTFSRPIAIHHNYSATGRQEEERSERRKADEAGGRESLSQIPTPHTRETRRRTTRTMERPRQGS